ncbi:MAG TPA: hypothetical protein VHO25_14460 [Polyangiaceae bacterium]|nr:hypothetical protein [Polyangiaceae bacterium]
MSSATQSLRWMAGVVGVFAVGVLVGWRVLGSPDSKPPSKNAAAASGAAGDGEDVQALRDEVSRLRAELRREKRLAQVTQASMQEPDQVADTPSAPRTPEEEAAWLAARAQFYDKVLKGERRNDAWAETLEIKAVSVAKTQEAQGVKLEDVRCYTNHCRMEYSYRDADARTQHLETIATTFTELQRVSYAYPGAPTVQNRAVLYMSTADYPFPDFHYEVAVTGNGTGATEP